MKKQLWLAWQRVASAKQLHQQLAWRRSGERPEKHETATERSAMSSTEEQKCPKTTYHTITVALMWQMVFSRPIWLLLGFLPNSQVQGEGWKEAKKQRDQANKLPVLSFQVVHHQAKKLEVQKTKTPEQMEYSKAHWQESFWQNNITHFASPHNSLSSLSV